jgi:hypothetical protein
MDQRAVDNFRTFYNSPYTLFLSDVRALLSAQANRDSDQQNAAMESTFGYCCY